MRMKNKGQIESLLLIVVIVSLVGLAGVFVYLYRGGQIKLPFGEKKAEGLGMFCIGKKADGTDYVAPCSEKIPLSIIEGTEGRYGIFFKLQVKNAGWSQGTPKNYDNAIIKSATNNINNLDLSGDLYNAFKNGQGMPVGSGVVTPESTYLWDSSQGTCDSVEVRSGPLEGFPSGVCYIPTSQAIGEHSSYEVLCNPGPCVWNAKVVADWTYAGETRTIESPPAGAQASIKPDPIAGIQVILVQTW